MIETLHHILLLVGGFFGISAIILIVPFTLIVGRHFDKLFRDRVPIGLSYYGFFPFPGRAAAARAISYGVYTVFDKRTKNVPERKRLYGNYNFRKNANRLHIVFSYMFVYSTILMIISAIPFVILQGLIRLQKNGYLYLIGGS